ncbi:MAG: hypothetical protein J7J82_08660 [Staphylothermus sp.]|nr:hypothetical protein [Staphylothermus sp.]
MNIKELFDKRINEIMDKYDLEKLKLLLETKIAYEKDSSSWIDDLKSIIIKSSGKPFFIAIQNHDLVELFVYNNKVKVISVSGRKPKKLEEAVELPKGNYKMTVYTTKLPASKCVNECVFGMDFMDKNHLDMFKIMDELILAIIDGRFEDIKILAEKLYIHTKDVHFKHEEVMKNTAYYKYYPDDYKIHIDWHRDLLDALKELKKNPEKEKYVEVMENLLIIFETYFEKYLKDTDAHLANYLKLVLPKIVPRISDSYG